MVPIPNVVGVMFCGFSKGGKTIEGELLRVEGDSYFVKGRDGKEVRLHVDETTEKARNINIGECDRIEEKVNDQNHALTNRLGPMNGCRTDMKSGCTSGRATPAH